MKEPTRVPKTIPELCETIVASKLLTGDEVESLRHTFDSSDNLSRHSPQAFAQFLIASRQLTPWQVYLLCDGKFRGYFLDHYKLVDQHYWTGSQRLCCIAQDQRSGEYVVLLISSSDGRIAYDVLPIWPAAADATSTNA